MGIDKNKAYQAAGEACKEEIELKKKRDQDSNPRALRGHGYWSSTARRRYAENYDKIRWSK